MKVENTLGMRTRKQHFLQHKGKSFSSKEAYMDGSKSTGRKVVYAVVYTDTTKRERHPEAASIHTAEMTAMKEDRRWAIYIDSWSSMLAIRNNRENHPILNHIYGILTELHNQGKQQDYPIQTTT